MLQDALMGDDMVDTGNSEDFINMTASVAASIDPIPFRKGGAGGSVPPVTRDNFKDAPNYTNYTGTSSTDSRAVSNEMINMLANGVIEDPLSAFPADSGKPYVALSMSARNQRHNNPVAPVAAQFLNKVRVRIAKQESRSDVAYKAPTFASLTLSPVPPSSSPLLLPS